MFSRLSQSTTHYALRRVLVALIIAFAPLLNLASPASAYLYSAPLTVTNNSTTTAYTMLPVVTPLNTAFLTSYGFMASSANDTRIQTTGGLDKPTMVSDNAVLTAVPVPITSQTNLLMTTGNTAQAMSIITGYNGYVTTNDTATLELGNNFSVLLGNAYFTMGTGSVVDKSTAFSVNTTSTNITATITNTATPTVAMLTQSGLDLWLPAQLLDGNPASYGFQTDTSGVGSYMRIDFGAGAGRQLTAWAYYVDGVTATWNIQYSDDAVGWTNAYVGLDCSGAAGWKTATWSGAGTHRYWQSYKTDAAALGNGFAELYVVGTAASVTSVMSAGVHTANISADGTNLYLRIDGGAPVSTALNGAYVVDIGNNLIWGQGNTAAYWGSIKVVTGGTERLWYQPVSYVIGTILPDRDGTKNGDITWGVNPYPVTSALSSLAAPTITVVSSTTSGTSDILPAAGGVDTNQEPGVNTKLLTNPLRPFIQIISLNTSVTEAQAWSYAALVVVLLPFSVATRKFKGHYVLTAILVCVMIYFVCAMGMWPWWTLIFMAPILFGGIVAERSPSL